MSKCPIGIGFHAGTPSRMEGIEDKYWKPLAENGHALFMQGSDNAGVCYQMQEYAKKYPDVHVSAVYRKTSFSHGDDVPLFHLHPEDEAARFWSEIEATWPKELDKNFVYVEFPNEIGRIHSEWLGEFCFHAGQIALDKGFRYASPAWSLGQPEPEDWVYFNDYLKLIAENPMRLAISLHEYTRSKDANMIGTIPYLMGRVQALNDYCREAELLIPPVFITEWGWGANDAPVADVAIPQIIDMVKWYIEHAPNVINVALWCLDSGWQWSELSKTISGYFAPLAAAINDTDWHNVEPPKPPAKEKHKVVIFKAAQEHQEQEFDTIAKKAFNEYKRTLTASHDDMLTMLKSGNEESYAVIFDPEYASQKHAIELLENNKLKHEVRYLHEHPTATPPHLLKYRPCDTTRITQYFAARPEYYAKAGLPGHEGIDFGTPLGSPIYAAEEGTVVWVGNTRPSGGRSAYGNHVYLRHTADSLVYHTVYAHLLDGSLPAMGNKFAAGAQIAKSGNTGASTGPHLHFGIMLPHDTGNGYPVWHFGQPVNPLPYLKGLNAPAPKATTFDMLVYMKGGGKMYEIRHAMGATETFQTQVDGNYFYQVKNSQWEQFFYDNTHIYRGRDTSPGPAPQGAERPGVNRFYDQYEAGKTLAKWIKRHMQKGETFIGSGHEVTFRYKDNCSKSALNSGHATNKVTFVDHHKSYIGYDGIELDDVIELKTGTGESMFFAKGYGLVGWHSQWGESRISEIHTNRPNLVREKINCA